MEVGIVWLVRAAWIASILPILIASIPSSKLTSFHQLVLGFAGRGKILHLSSQVSTLAVLVTRIPQICLRIAPIGLLIKWTVPQKYFAHFYVVGAAWTTLLLATTWMYACKTAPLSSEEFHLSDIASHLTGGSHVFSFHKSHLTPVEHHFKVWRAVFLLVLMEIQVLRRLIESFYVFKYSPSARLHILGYLVGGSLRENPSQAKEYIIPHGDWFEIVSSPHYLAEIVLYLGLLIASGGTEITIWLLHGFVVGNLTLAAGETHRWYLRKFENYPANRNAIFPYVY
uniref:3-oxo-5-alpha-steroid 4-dehydrogenase C-terminal domain-containing protein n=1 Tax=Brassica campestris TaxID=3711 RepID=M4CCP9_BRACM